MIELNYKNFYKNGGTFIYTVSKKNIQTALRKIMRKYFEIKKEDTVVHATKARWIIDWFLGDPIDEECGLLEFLMEEFNKEIHDFFAEKAREECERV